MSNTKEFQWTDSLVSEYIRWCQMNGSMEGFKKSKEPKFLFNSADHVPVYTNQKVWLVNSDFSIGQVSYLEGHPSESQNVFTTKEGAYRYVLMSKPCLSLKNIVDSSTIKSLGAVDTGEKYLEKREVDMMKLQELVKSRS